MTTAKRRTPRENIGVAVPIGFKEVIERAAYKERKSVNSWIIEAITQHCPPNLRKKLPAVSNKLGRPRKESNGSQ